MPTLSREQIIHPLVTVLETVDFVQAVWQGGAAAFSRVDEWSDIDLVIVAEDDKCDDIWPVVDQIMAQIGTVDTCFRIPAPPLGLHSQRFYRLAEAGPYLLVDIGVFGVSAPDKLLGPATHGDAMVHFDKTGVTRGAAPHADANGKAIAARLEQLRVSIPLFQCLVQKELNRGNDIEAIAFYHAWSLRPLVELLRMKHCPGRYQFHTRYIQHDLPKDVVDRLRPMFFVRDLEDVGRRRQEAEAWAMELLRG